MNDRFEAGKAAAAALMLAAVLAGVASVGPPGSPVGAGLAHAQVADPDEAPAPSEDDGAAAQEEAAEAAAPERRQVVGGADGSATTLTGAERPADTGEADDDGGDGIFVPSEEIRVDSAIAFPVDI